METWHWSVRVVVQERTVIEETGDLFGAYGCWVRVGETLRRRGDDIAALAMNGRMPKDFPMQGNTAGPRIEIVISVDRVP